MRRRTLLGGVAAAAAVHHVSAAVRHRPAAHGPATHGIVRVRVQSHAHATHSPVTFAQAFAAGAIPAGSRVALASSAGAAIPVQQDQENHWPDGSLRCAALSFIAPESLAPGSIHAYDIAAAPGAPDRAPGVSAAQLAQASDLKLKIGGYDYGADSYTVSVNDVLATLPAWRGAAGWNTSPLGGWEMVRSGPICTEWRIWRMLKRDSDGASHRWVKAVLYVRAWGPAGPFEIMPSLRQSNSYGPVAGATAGAQGAQPAYIGVAELWDGGRRLYAWGGRHDPRAGTIPADAFDTEHRVLTAKAGRWAQTAGMGLAFSGPGAPSALPRGQVLWTTASFNGQPALAATRGTAWIVPDGRYDTWRPSAQYGYGWIISANDSVWLCTQSGKTAATGHGPTGSGAHVQDGSVVWTCASVAFGHRGRGRATVTPVVATFPGANLALADVNGDPVWAGPQGSVRPALTIAHDAGYLTRQSRLVPSYDLTLNVQPDPAAWRGIYQPNTPSIYSDSTGDNAGDERIGYLSDSQVHLLLSPLDPVRELTCKSLALSFLDFPGCWEDERTGQPVLRGSKAYPGLIPNPGFAMGDWGHPRGNPVWQGTGATANMYPGRYRPLMDGSHLPALWIMPYLRTGHALYTELGLLQAVTMLASQAPDSRDPKVHGTVYENCVLGPYNQQVRGMGWSLRLLGTLDATLPDSDPMRPFVRDTVDANAAFGAAWPATIDPRLVRLGCLWEIGSSVQFMSPFFYHMLATCLATEAWRAAAAGNRPGFMALQRAAAHFTVAAWDSRQGGSGYYADAYHLNWTAGPGGSPAGAYPDMAAMMRANFPNAPPQPTSIFEDGGGGKPAPPSVLIAKNMLQGEASFPYTANSLVAITAGALAAQATAGVPDAAETYASLHRRVSAPPLRGIAFTGRDRNSGAPLAFPVWAIVPA